MTTVEDLLRKGARVLVGVESSRLDAEVLLAHVLGVERIRLISGSKEQVSDVSEVEFLELVAKRAERQPIAYLTGTKPFWSSNFNVSPAVLIPRPETELLVEAVLSWAENCGHKLKILELGVGSACISISIALELQNRGIDFEIVGIDKSPDALQVARENCSIHNMEDSIELFQGNWYSGLDRNRKFDCIVSNPPYVRLEAEDMSPETRFEPEMALYAEDEGLSDVYQIIQEAPQWLHPGGHLWCEIGEGQAANVKAFCKNSAECTGAQLRFTKDLAGIDRIFHVWFSSKV